MYIKYILNLNFLTAIPFNLSLMRELLVMSGSVLATKLEMDVLFTPTGAEN